MTVLSLQILHERHNQTCVTLIIISILPWLQKMLKFWLKIFIVKLDRNPKQIIYKNDTKEFLSMGTRKPVFNFKWKYIQVVYNTFVKWGIHFSWPYHAIPLHATSVFWLDKSTEPNSYCVVNSLQKFSWRKNIHVVLWHLYLLIFFSYPSSKHIPIHITKD